MKPKSLKSIIKQARKGLQWPTIENPVDTPMIRIVSYPRCQSHTILMPDKLHNRSTDMDYLHELGHAALCETVHPVFAANIQFAPQMKKRLFLPVIPALNAACDWYVGHWQMGICPDITLKHLKETLPVAEEVLSSPQLPPLEVILDAAMIIAQAIHYLDEPLECGGALKLAVEAFLSVPPEEPSLDGCVQLVNRLMATYGNERVRFNEDGDATVWEVYLPEDTPSAAMGSATR